MPKTSDGINYLTVGELIEELSKHDKNLPVMTEGCDCYGEADHVSTFERYHGNGEYETFVLINRQEAVSLAADPKPLLSEDML